MGTISHLWDGENNPVYYRLALARLSVDVFSTYLPIYLICTTTRVLPTALHLEVWLQLNSMSRCCRCQTMATLLHIPYKPHPMNFTMERECLHVAIYLHGLQSNDGVSVSGYYWLMCPCCCVRQWRMGTALGSVYFSVLTRVSKVYQKCNSVAKWPVYVQYFLGYSWGTPLVSI